MNQLEDKNRAHEETAFIFEWKEDFRGNLSTIAVLQFMSEFCEFVQIITRVIFD